MPYTIGIGRRQVVALTLKFMAFTSFSLIVSFLEVR